MDAKEKTFMCIGDSNFRSVSGGMTAAVAKKYAGGGITDGVEVSWAKKKELPPELAAALGHVGILAGTDEGEPNQPKTEKVIDLLQDPRIRRNTVSNDTKGIGDGVSMQWSKNSRLFEISFFYFLKHSSVTETPLTGDSNARQEVMQRENAKMGKGKSKKHLLSVFGKKK